MSPSVELLSSLSAAVHADITAADRPVEDLPAVLTAAASGVLGVAGASLSLISMDLRVPLGGSSPEAVTAEQLQFTVGEGPCLEVLREVRPVAYTLAELEHTWPLFTDELVRNTSFRSVASVPLPFTADSGGGALDVYSRQPDGAMRVDLVDAGATADWIVGQLVAALPRLALAGADDVSRVPWLNTVSPLRRMEVWVALGLLGDRLALTASDALALLRGWAHSHGVDVDTVAEDLTSGRLDPERLRP